MSSIETSRAGAPGARQTRKRKGATQVVDTAKAVSKGHTRTSAKREGGPTWTSAARAAEPRPQR
jgi:hypothetical protein